MLDRTARRVKQYAQAQFNNGNFGITIDQWGVLKNLHENGKLSQKELAECCGKDCPTLTRIIDLLESKNLVKRKQHERDRRSFVVELTPLGNEKHDELLDKVQEIRVHAWQNLNETDFENLKRILNTIYDNLK